ncbi:unnamed protein product [Nippostrongylus brasiliensis]|uniref:Uncharacterized protein n=1 Tax=Nippostrongylus brasiliensis TaxID=27835 RepID=A0A0N4XRA3_NIPBR|nr:unnamed protein product [Nippostrongylus brasiliensis]
MCRDKIKSKMLMEKIGHFHQLHSNSHNADVVLWHSWMHLGPAAEASLA